MKRIPPPRASLPATAFELIGAVALVEFFDGAYAEVAATAGYGYARSPVPPGIVARFWDTTGDEALMPWTIEQALAVVAAILDKVEVAQARLDEEPPL